MVLVCKGKIDDEGYAREVRAKLNKMKVCYAIKKNSFEVIYNNGEPGTARYIIELFDGFIEHEIFYQK